MESDYTPLDQRTVSFIVSTFNKIIDSNQHIQRLPTKEIEKLKMMFLESMEVLDEPKKRDDIDMATDLTTIEDQSSSDSEPDISWEKYVYNQIMGSNNTALSDKEYQDRLEMVDKTLYPKRAAKRRKYDNPKS